MHYVAISHEYSSFNANNFTIFTLKIKGKLKESERGDKQDYFGTIYCEQDARSWIDG